MKQKKNVPLASVEVSDEPDRQRHDSQQHNETEVKDHVARFNAGPEVQQEAGERRRDVYEEPDHELQEVEGENSGHHNRDPGEQRLSEEVVRPVVLPGRREGRDHGPIRAIPVRHFGVTGRCQASSNWLPMAGFVAII